MMMELTEYLRNTWSLEGVGPITRGQRERIHEAAAEIVRLRAELASYKLMAESISEDFERTADELEARDGQIAAWLRGQAEEDFPFGLDAADGAWTALELSASAIETGSYRKDEA